MSDTHLVLHGLAIKKNGTPEAIADLMGLDAGDVRAVLASLVETQRVVEVQGKYLLAPLARLALDADYARRYGALRADPVFAAGYEGFERINGTLKQVITDWQTIAVGGERVLNPHADEDYDGKIIDRLGALHERAEGILAGLAGVLPRLEVYRDKLTGALEKAEDGDIAWVSDARIESYHTLWFELHEDLLRLMGRERED